MNKILLSFLLLFYPGIAVISQITAIPALPTDTDQVTITFDASQGSAGLKDFTGDIYAHTGVITNLSSSGSDWKYVIAGWTTNTTKAKLTALGNNKFQLTIGPSIRAFYGVPAGETIKQLAFVFRNSDGSKTGKTASNGDIFYNVYATGLSVIISNPLKDKPIYELNSSISIQASANNSNSLKLFIDNIEVSSTTSSSITFDYAVNNYGKHWFKAIASDGTNTKKDSTYIIVRPEVTTEAIPSGLTPGVNVINSNTVTIVLNDPPAKKQYCYLIGNFSDWMLDDVYYMKRTPDGKYFWLTLTGLDPNIEYLYQYFIDGQLKLADPYTTKTSDPNDQYISTINYPNLISYPKDKTSGIVTTFKINEEAYNWNTTNFSAPAKQNLIIYELHIRDFINGDYIKTAKDSLNYLKKLGVNAIELMPFNEFEGNDSWGYNPSFYFAPDKAYGTKNDYKAFIDACHDKGIAVIQDIVFNHSYGQSPLVQMYFSEGKPSADNPWYNQSSPNTTYSWGYDFNHESQYTKAFMDSVLRYWMKEYKVDGFRFDFTKGFTNTPGDGGGYDASRIAILERMASRVWEVKPNAYIILEHFAANTEEKVLADYGMMIWGNMNYNYNEASMGYVSTSDFSGISYKNRGWNNPCLVGYMESHDEERLMFKNKTYGNSTNASYNIKNLQIGLARNELAAVFFFTVPGPKMIWQFGELGYDISIDQNGRVGRKPIHWDYFNDPNRKHLLGVYSQLTELKKSYSVFSTSDFSTFFSGAKKWIKLNGSDMNAVVMGNFDVQSSIFVIDFQNTGKWYEYFTQDSINISTTTYTTTFNPGEYRLYTSKRIKKTDIFLGIDNSSTSNNSFDFDLWPNPSEGNINLNINIPLPQKVSVAIFSIIGQNVFSKDFSNLSIGSNTIKVNLPLNITKGVYLCRIVSGNKVSTKKLIIN